MVFNFRFPINVDQSTLSFPAPYRKRSKWGARLVIQGEFDGERFKATTILAQFSSEYFPIAALDELQSYGVLIDKD